MYTFVKKNYTFDAKPIFTLISSFDLMEVLPNYLKIFSFNPILPFLEQSHLASSKTGFAFLGNSMIASLPNVIIVIYSSCMRNQKQ